MKPVISQISKTFLTLILAISMMCHVILPFSVQANKAAFTYWLSNSIASEAESEVHLRHSILRISDRSSSFLGLVEEASELVQSHRDKFHLNLSVPSEKETPPAVSLLLLNQWSLFNTQKGSQDAVLPEITQPVQKWLNPPLFSLISQQVQSSAGFLAASAGRLSDFISPLQHILSPLSGGISINAP